MANTPNPESLVVDASDLALPVGQWPARLIHAGARFTFTELRRDADHDVLLARYRDDAGRVLTVFND
jgi:hypothetical protein